MLNAPVKNSGNFEPAKEGLQPAICVSLVHIGTQTTEWEGNEKKVDQIVISHELCKDTREYVTDEGKPMEVRKIISHKLTRSLHPKANLRKFIESWRGKSLDHRELSEFDLFKLVGVQNTLQIVHTVKGENVYANILSILPANASGQKKYTPERDLITYSVAQSTNIPEGIPDWMRELIYQSEEWQGDDSPANQEAEDFYTEQQEPNQEPAQEPDEEDDIPF